MIKTLSYTSKGPRQSNQDFIASSEFDVVHSVYIVADGMGGYEYGEVASQIVATSIIDFFSDPIHWNPTKLIFEKLASKLYQNLKDEANKLSCAQLGSTVACVFFTEESAFLFWIGDVRIYHFRQGQLIYQTRDHSFLNEMKENGTITAELIQRYSHIVSRSLNNKALSTFDFTQTKFLSGDTIIICSDGVHNIVPESLLTSLINTQPIIIQPIIDYCSERAKDNFSIILLNI
jgi:serine/threonine protein phosphatase PrpC